MDDERRELSADEIAHLRLYEPATYGIALPRALAKSLEAKGFVEWLPPTGWSGTIWGITGAGRSALSRTEGSQGGGNG